MLTKPTFKQRLLALSALMVTAPMAWSFDSGSTGADGAFSPVVDTELQLPADGIFNFTSVNIPAGVTVTFARNQANTPVTWLVGGDVTINGAINLNGTTAPGVGTNAGGNIGDDGLPGIGGPGGFDGGRGGTVADTFGSAGLGPGGGQPASGTFNLGGCGGAGGGFANTGTASFASTSASTSSTFCTNFDRALGGSAYGNEELLPLIGGSGGGGASAGSAFNGAGGGGGGGAILIASSGTISVNGSITANGGRGGNASGQQIGGGGGSGSGGAIRLIAEIVQGNGTISANGGGRSDSSLRSDADGGNGSAGRIRIESETFLRTAATSPAFSFSQPQDVFVAGLPSLRITSVAGVDAPAAPTGSADIVLPSTTQNPVAIQFATTNVPLGNTVELILIPVSGDTVTTVSNAISGTEAAGSAFTSVELPEGPSTLLAQVTYTVTVAQAESFSAFTEGELVASVRLSADPVQGSQTTFITESGKEYTVPSNLVAFN